MSPGMQIQCNVSLSFWCCTTCPNLNQIGERVLETFPRLFRIIQTRRNVNYILKSTFRTPYWVTTHRNLFDKTTCCRFMILTTFSNLLYYKVSLDSACYINDEISYAFSRRQKIYDSFYKQAEKFTGNAFSKWLKWKLLNKCFHFIFITDISETYAIYQTYL